MKRWILVTGASGFIGARLVRELVANGESVKAFVRPGSSLTPLEGLPRQRFALAFGDVRVEHTVYRALAGCDRLYHAAASEMDGVDAAAVSAVTHAVLEAARKRRLERVVVTRCAAQLPARATAEPFGEADLPAQSAAAGARLPVVTVLPACTIGAGDRRPACLGSLVARYLRWPPSARVPLVAGGLSVVDVEDVVQGHVLAMQRGQAGERYILGGENLTYDQLFTTLHELTSLARPSGAQSGPSLALRAAWHGIKAVLQGDEPLLTARLLRDYSDKYVFVSSARAERELGYSYRPGREALARAVLWFLEKGYVPERAARRVRLELRSA
jgi:dihydroflavonol-4-reductase